jgi:hypothetical protein
MAYIDLGIEWYSVVHHGTNLRKGDYFVEFKEFFSMMKKRISDGADVPYFFKDLVAMITDVTEDEWGTPKDPSTKLSKESTLRSYAKRGLSQKFAQSIVYRLKPEMFIESLNTRPDTVRQLLADDFKPFDATADANNIASKLAAVFTDIIKVTAGIVEPSDLEKQKLQQLEQDLRNKYGDYLINEANHVCPFPGCSRSLIVAKAGKATNLYNVGLIDKKKAPTVENLLALCPHCYATYSIDDNAKICKELNGVKKILVAHQQSVQLLDDLPLEKGIVGVISKVKNLKEKDLADASLDPKEIKQKLKPSDNMVLYTTVNAYVTAYYIKLHEIMMNADKRGEIDYDEVQDQMHAIYKRLKKAKKTKVEIFNEIAQKIHKVSLQEDIFCQIVVSYFIQSCEVFDAIT